MPRIFSYDYKAKTLNSFESDEYDVDVFRKKLSPLKSYSDMTEMIICERLYDSPQKNVVKIFNVTNEYIDVEMVRQSFKMKLPQKAYMDLFAGIQQLHTLGIAYIDMKHDNCGYSAKDKVWKWFDFDIAGVVDSYDTSKWLRRPLVGFILKDIMRMNPIIEDLRDLDAFAWQLYMEREKERYRTAAKTKKGAKRTKKKKDVNTKY
jgi:serine/threonine protein kinase